MASVKIRISWTDENVIKEGVRIYKSNQEFDVNSKPAPLVEIRDGAEFYEDLNVVEGQTYFYMLSVFNNGQEVFTECYEVVAKNDSYIEIFFKAITSVSVVHVLTSQMFQRCFFNLDGSEAITFGGVSSAGEISTYKTSTPFILKEVDTKLGSFVDTSITGNISNLLFFSNGEDVIVHRVNPFSLTHYKLDTPFKFNSNSIAVRSVASFNGYTNGIYQISTNGVYVYRIPPETPTYIEQYTLSDFAKIDQPTLVSSEQITQYGNIPDGVNRLTGVFVASDGMSLWVTGERFSSPYFYDYGTVIYISFSEAFTIDPIKRVSYLPKLINQPDGLSNMSKMFGDIDRFCGTTLVGSSSNYKFTFFTFT